MGRRAVRPTASYRSAEALEVFLVKKIVIVVLLTWGAALIVGVLTRVFESTAYANGLLSSKNYPLILALGAFALTLMVGVLGVVRHWARLHCRGWRPDSYIKLVAGLVFGLIIVTYANAASIWVFSFGFQSLMVDVTSQSEQVYRVSAVRTGQKGCPNALTWDDPQAGRKIWFCRSIALFDERDGYTRPTLVKCTIGPIRRGDSLG
jgi:hypothetical protein